MPPGVVCYYDNSQVWWLSKRQTSVDIPDGNFWKTFTTTDPDPLTNVVVTAVDWGDLLESSPNLNLRRIRTEVTLFKDATGAVDLDTDFAQFIAADPGDFVAPFSGQCAEDVTTSTSQLGCFAAFAMSGPVPGTEQSINELQGTNFGLDFPEMTAEHTTASGTLVDPTTVRAGFHATVYSHCARFFIQQIVGTPAQVDWDPLNHRWTDGANLPVVDLKTWQGTYTTEINATGTLIYGYNWNSQNEASGTYRLTYLLDAGENGGADEDHCTGAVSNTVFTEETVIANPGESATAVLVPVGDPRLLGDSTVAGLTYIDVTLKTKGGGQGGGKGGGKGG